MTGRPWQVWCAGVVFSALVVGCSGGGSGSSGGDDLAPASAGVVDARALSNHYVEVGFAGAAGNDAGDPDSYVITDPDGTRLAVSTVQVSDDRTQAILTTDAQEAVQYRLTMQNSGVQASAIADDVATNAEVVFNGSIQLEPFVASAISLNANEILLTFSETMSGATVADTRYYEIADPDLAVTAAVLQADGKSAILTTSDQANVGYTVRVTNVTNKTGQLINPVLNEGEFSGIPPVDDIRPTLVRAESTSATTALLWFSEPLADSADDPTNYRICMTLDVDCTPATQLVITGAELTAENTRVVLTTLPQVAGIEYRVEVANVVDRATPPPANSIDPEQDSATFTFAGTPGVDDGTTAPRVVGAASLGNTSVVVTFSKPMGDSALNLANYVIVQVNVNSEVGALAVVSGKRVRDGGNGIAETTADGDDVQIYDMNAEVTPGAILIRQGDDGELTSTPAGDDVVEDLPAPQFVGNEHTAVVLTTLSQGEVTYEVTVVNVRDLAGNGLAPPQLLVEPSKATFPGTPPGSEAELLDSDGDGLADRDEQAGWVVTVHLANGDVRRTEVTGNPYQKDSDNDDLTDLEEAQLLLNPRAADTDADGLNDYDEYNVWFSEPTVQDTDGDGIGDGSEVNFFRTSPVIADTDGDQMTDAEELFELNRDPRISDLPRPRIIIGDAALRLDTRFSFTDTQGVSRTSEESVETTLEKSQSETFSRSDSSTSERVIENTTKAGVEVEGEAGIKSLVSGPKITVSAETAFTFGFTDTETTTVDRESAEEASQTYQKSLTTSETVDETQEVTREVVGASIQIPLSVANNGDIPFSLTNLEVTALLQDPRDRTRFVPVATLVPESALDTGEIPEINTGPFLPQRGPFIFTSREVFPSLVEDLLRDPRGLIFEVANFDVTDESGRNLAFISQEVNDRTAGIVIDYGGRAEHFRVATNSTFDDEGRPVGITLGYALQDILGMPKNGAPDAITVGPDGCGVTQAVGDDVQVAVPACPPVTPGGPIVEAGPNGIVDSIPRGDDVIGLFCDDASVTPGASCTQDSDCQDMANTAGECRITKIVDGGDGCAHSRAFVDDVQLVGQCDAGADNAGTPCTSDSNCTNGTCVGACTVGGADGEIVTAGPNGVLDTMSAGDDEVTTITGYATEVIGLCDAASVTPGAACTEDGDCQDGAHPDGACRQRTEIPTRVRGVRRNPATAQFWLVLASAPFDVSTNFDDIPVHAGDRISLAYVQDKDDDGLIARQEFLYGSSDNRVDSDDDALSDYDEVVLGWQVEVEGQPARTAYSDPARPDSDADRLTDAEEYLLGTDPRKRDTDDDGITDFEEVNGFPVLDKNRQSVLAVVLPYEGDFPMSEIKAVIDGGNGIAETQADTHDDQVIPVGKSVSAFGVVVLAGDDMNLDTATPAGDDQIVSGEVGVNVVAHGGLFATDPLDPDTDDDGLLDGLERRLGANANDRADADDFRDNDFDGLVNAAETKGWKILVDERRRTEDNEVMAVCEPVICNGDSVMPAFACSTDADCADGAHPGGQCVRATICDTARRCDEASAVPESDCLTDVECTDGNHPDGHCIDVSLDSGSPCSTDDACSDGLHPDGRCVAAGICNAASVNQGGYACSADTDCNDNHPDGRCVDAGICNGDSMMPRSACLNDADCQDGGHPDGKCVEAAVCDMAGICNGDSVMPDAFCSTNADCADAAHLDGKCVNMLVTAGSVCSDDTDCTDADHPDGRCVQPWICDVASVIPYSACLTDAECADGNHPDGRCVQAAMCDDASVMPRSTCSTDADCTDGDYADGRCDFLIPVIDRQDPPTGCKTEVVTSDPFEPDTDFDGLPDLLESTLGTNPRLRDTDGDGLLDFDEFNPESPFSIDFATFREFEDLCFEADRCVYDPTGSLLFGTDLSVPDTDGDGRTDPMELFRGWTVSPFGKLPYVVMSSPVDADADRDGADDLQEHANATDPGNADTDGDGVLDGADANPTGFGKGIFVRLESWNVGADDCDKGTGEQYGDFKYVFAVNRLLPDGSKATVFSVQNTNIVQLGTFENDPLHVKKLQLNFTDTESQLTLGSGEILELFVHIDELQINAESRGGDEHWEAKQQYSYSDVSTGEVVMSADSGCFGDDKVRWYISVGN